MPGTRRHVLPGRGGERSGLDPSFDLTGEAAGRGADSSRGCVFHVEHGRARGTSARVAVTVVECVDRPLLRRLRCAGVGRCGKGIGWRDLMFHVEHQASWVARAKERRLSRPQICSAVGWHTAGPWPM